MLIMKSSKHIFHIQIYLFITLVYIHPSLKVSESTTIHDDFES